MPSNLWILTEERPKKEVIQKIIEKFLQDHEIAGFIDGLRIIPVLSKDGLFTSKYQILGVQTPSVEKVFLRIITGNSSFVDYLVYFQDEEPTPSQRPIYAIEETKTDDAESRNTGVYQRATKFVYVDIFYPGVDATMLYNLQVQQKVMPTASNVFGTRCFKALGVKFIGKSEDLEQMAAFTSVDELIDFKAAMKRAPTGNVPIQVQKDGDLITVSGRLFKAGGLAYDPNIGALSLISAALRKLGWKGRIQITQHGLEQSHVRAANKFVQIANHLNIEIQGLEVPKAKFPDAYWRYESTGEKLGSIFVHLVVEEFSKGFSIYENHAGGERGYFYKKDGTPIAVSKRVVDESGRMAKSADKIPIPDLVLIDLERLEIINIEGERAQNMEVGIRQLEGFSFIEDHYIRQYYPEFKVLRTVVLYGGEETSVSRVEVSFLLNSQGQIILGVQAPELFKESVKNLLDYWKT
jgi:hypothetical protein